MMRKLLLYVLLSAGAAVCAFPFVWMLTTAFKTYQESVSPTLSLFPEKWQWGNLGATFHAAPFATYFYNSFLVAVIVTTAVILTSLMAG